MIVLGVDSYLFMRPQGAIILPHWQLEDHLEEQLEIRPQVVRQRRRLQPRRHLHKGGLDVIPLDHERQVALRTEP